MHGLDMNDGSVERLLDSILVLTQFMICEQNPFSESFPTRIRKVIRNWGNGMGNGFELGSEWTSSIEFKI